MGDKEFKTEDIKQENTIIKEKNEIIEETKTKKQETKAETIRYNKYEENITKPHKSKALIIALIIAIIALIIAIFSTIFALVNMNNTTILAGISIKGIGVEGLTKEEAIAKVTEELSKELQEDIVLNYQEFSTTLTGEQIEFSYNIEEAINEAYSIGREGNIFQNNYQIIGCLLKETNVNIEQTYNEEQLNNIIADINTKIPGATIEYSYYIEDGNLIVTPGQQGISAQNERLKKLILSAIETTEEEDNTIEIPVQIVDPEEIDISKIHQEIYVEPQDAYYTTEPFTIYPHVVGVDFKETEEEIKAQIDANPGAEEYTIELKYTTPEVTTNQIGTEAFPNLLSTFSTKYDITNTNRSTNLELAAAKINGTILMPGEEFSYNKVVGERTIAAGYKEAKIYSGGKIVDGLGGGICQISSTLYDAVLYANLDITSRRNHQFTTSYIDAGLDATVVYGSTDFKFVNNRTYPIKIVAEVKNGIAKIDIYGVKEEIEYEVKLEATVLSYIPYTTQYVTDSTLASGQQVVKQKGSNGCKTVTYKYLLLNGTVISKTELSRDTYNAIPKIVNVGP